VETTPSRYEVTVMYDRCLLHILELNEQTKGTYIARATNEAGEELTTCVLEIGEPEPLVPLDTSIDSLSVSESYDDSFMSVRRSQYQKKKIMSELQMAPWVRQPAPRTSSTEWNESADESFLDVDRKQWQTERHMSQADVRRSKKSRKIKNTETALWSEEMDDSFIDVDRKEWETRRDVSELTKKVRRRPHITELGEEEVTENKSLVTESKVVEEVTEEIVILESVEKKSIEFEAQQKPKRRVSFASITKEIPKVAFEEQPIQTEEEIEVTERVISLAKKPEKKKKPTKEKKTEEAEEVVEEIVEIISKGQPEKKLSVTVESEGIPVAEIKVERIEKPSVIIESKQKPEPETTVIETTKKEDIVEKEITDIVEDVVTIADKQVDKKTEKKVKKPKEVPKPDDQKIEISIGRKSEEKRPITVESKGLMQPEISVSQKKKPKVVADSKEESIQETSVIELELRQKPQYEFQEEQVVEEYFTHGAPRKGEPSISLSKGVTVEETLTNESTEEYNVPKVLTQDRRSFEAIEASMRLLHQQPITIEEISTSEGATLLPEWPKPAEKRAESKIEEHPFVQVSGVTSEMAPTPLKPEKPKKMQAERLPQEEVTEIIEEVTVKPDEAETVHIEGVVERDETGSECVEVMWRKNHHLGTKTTKQKCRSSGAVVEAKTTFESKEVDITLAPGHEEVSKTIQLPDATVKKPMFPS
ncbi:hypothetical protein BIW11_05575, partial [Tropilaelaps mercedesae]